MSSLSTILVAFATIDVVYCVVNATASSEDLFTIQVNSNQTKLDCDDIFLNQTFGDGQSLTYYEITVDEDLETPSKIIACHPLPDNINHNYTDLDFYMYLFKQIGSTQTIMAHPIKELISTPQCDGYGLQMDLTSLVQTKQYGTYFIVVEDAKHAFSMQMTCGTTSESESNATMLIIVLSVVMLCIIIFCGFYCFESRRLRKRYPQTIHDEHSDVVDTDSEEHGAAVENGSDKLIIDVVLEEEDGVIKVMQDILKSVEENDGLDIYQVLAFRAKDKISRSMRLEKPFSKFKINMDILYLSSYQRVLYVAIIAFSLQVIGITVIFISESVYKFKKDEIYCDYNVADWGTNNNWIYKILAFLWASVITLNIGIYNNKIHDQGLNKIVDQIPNEEYIIFDCVDIVLLHLGLWSNLYTLLVAVVGSYFIVFTSYAGTDAIGMVLNAVALFFMIELDDMLVTKNDYRDVEKGCTLFLQNYIKQKEQNIPRQRHKEYCNAHDHNQLFGIKGLSRLTKCVESFGHCITVITMVLGFIAPILILICYQGFPENS